MKIENFILCAIDRIDQMTHQETPAQKLRDIENQLVEIITSMGQLKGRSDKMAKLAACITIRGEVTQKLLREITGYSLGTVSSSLQILEKMGFVSKYKDSNSREYLYRYEESYAQSQSRSIMNVLEYFRELDEFLKQMDDKLDKPHLKGKEGYENITEFIENMRRLFPAVEEALSKFSGPAEKGSQDKR
jgi:DNA-binding transcriptional regulator GbsR (MarR family)